MTGRTYSHPFARAFTTAGVPAAGEKLYFYLAGGTTATDTYADAALSVPNANPVVADSAGRWPAIFLDPDVSYRIVQKTAADVEVDDVDGYTIPVPLEMADVIAAVAAALTSGSNITFDYDPLAGPNGEIDLDADTTDARPLEACIVPIFDTATVVTAGTGKFTFRAPFAMDVYEVRASLATAQATNGAGGILTVDINDDGTSILSTKLTIDNTEKTSETAQTPPVLNDDPVTIADDSEITIDVDQVGDGTAKGLNVTLIFRRA